MKIILRLSALILLCFVMLAGSGCGGREAVLDYKDTTLWYLATNKPGEKSFDVFYLLPTCVWDRVAADGDTLYYADPFLESDREAMRPSFELAKSIFGDNANFYSPYYRHVALQSWRSDSLVEARFPRSFDDVKRAFSFYMKNINEGRPFVLAGFSQGAKCVVELLKTLNDKQYEQLIAAYVIGYRVTDSDTLKYKHIRPAAGEEDCGVTVCYNSVATPEAASPVLSPSALCINPVNWTTSSTSAALNDTVSVHIDKLHNLLIVEGFNPDNYYAETLGFLFKKGNYHLQELTNYQNYLSKNVKTRYDSYLNQ